MALIYRSLPRNCLQSSSESTASRALQYLSHQIREIWYFLRAQKTLIPRVKLGSSNGQLENCPCRSGSGQGRGRAQVLVGCPSTCLFGPSLGACPRGLAWAMLPCCGPVPWGPWHGDVQTLRWIHLPSCRPAQPDLSLLNRALLGRAARKKAASGRTGPGANRSGSETNGADGPGFCSLIPLF